MTAHNPLRKAIHAIPLALFSGLLLTAGMCRQAEEIPDVEPTTYSETEQPLDVAAEEEAALAAAAAAAQAEQERLAAIDAAEQELAEREARLAAEREELRRQRAIQAEQVRLAAERAAAAERERELAAREQELREREAGLAQREEELAEVTPSTPEPDEPYDEPWRELPEAEEDETAALPAAVDEPPAPVTASLQPGKVIELEILETLSSRTSRVGDTFSSRLVQDLRDAEGTLVVPAGAEIIGRVTEVTPLKRVGGRASLGVEFTHVVVSPDQTVGINASFVELGADKRKDKKKIAAGAVVGAILGHVLGGDGSKNVLVGAAVGAAAGTAVVASAKDKDAVIPAGEFIALQLEEVVTVEIEYGPRADDG